MTSEVQDEFKLELRAAERLANEPGIPDNEVILWRLLKLQIATAKLAEETNELIWGL